MKFHSSPARRSASSAPFAKRRLRAFTLTEMMIAVSIYLMVIGGVVYSNIVGAKMYQITKSKLGANDQARAAISLLVGEVRAASDLEIGRASGTNFVAVTNGAAQQGEALQIYVSNNYSSFVRYYLATNSVNGNTELRRMTNGQALPHDVVAETITNKVIFTAESFNGTVYSNNYNNRVIGVVLQFYQIRYPVLTIGPSNYYEYYALRTKITRRAIQ